jgi:hypothetical protein
MILVAVDLLGQVVDFADGAIELGRGFAVAAAAVIVRVHSQTSRIITSEHIIIIIITYYIKIWQHKLQVLKKAQNTAEPYLYSSLLRPLISVSKMSLRVCGLKWFK